MNHIAIMKKSWDLIPKILEGTKTIESRWYKARFAPWDRVHSGDTIYFKDSGEPVTVVAQVSKVLQFKDLDKQKFITIIENYAEEICLLSTEYNDYYKSRNYCILIFLENSRKLDKPFNIDKTGYGNACAWMCVEDVEDIKSEK
jgi:predicted transcriptional regulator